MTVGAIYSLNPVRYEYSTSTEYKYFGTTVSENRLNELMVRYGIRQTGDSEKDLRALYAAMYAESVTELESAQATTNSGNQGSQPTQSTLAQNSSNVPWATLMGQVGLQATGNYETDYAAFNDKISLMQSAALSPQDKASVDQLTAEAAVVFVPPEQSTAQAASSQNQTPQQPTGADITAQLNKLFLVTG